MLKIGITPTLHWAVDHKLIGVTIALVLGLGLAGLLLFRLAGVARFVALLVLLMTPFAVLTVMQTTWAILSPIPVPKPIGGFDEADGAVQAPQGQPASSRLPRRLVWIIFDELDYRLTFVDRPESVRLPEIDRFRAGAMLATDAHSLGKDTTEAVSSFLGQVLIEDSKPTSADQLLVRPEGAEKDDLREWPDGQTLIEKAHGLGAKIGIVGFYLPYCRIFGEELEYCRSYPHKSHSPVATNSVGTEMVSQLIWVTIGQRYVMHQIVMESLDSAVDLVRDDSFDLALIHSRDCPARC